MLRSAVVDCDDGLYELKKACNECDDADSDVERLQILRRWELREGALRCMGDLRAHCLAWCLLDELNRLRLYHMLIGFA